MWAFTVYKYTKLDLHGYPLESFFTVYFVQMLRYETESTLQMAVIMGIYCL
jgi:hypothetical protein